jgi:hypothetical protein
VSWLPRSKRKHHSASERIGSKCLGDLATLQLDQAFGHLPREPVLIIRVGFAEAEPGDGKLGSIVAVVTPGGDRYRSGFPEPAGVHLDHQLEAATQQTHIRENVRRRTGPHRNVTSVCTQVRGQALCDPLAGNRPDLDVNRGDIIEHQLQHFLQIPQRRRQSLAVWAQAIAGNANDMVDALKKVSHRMLGVTQHLRPNGDQLFGASLLRTTRCGGSQQDFTRSGFDGESLS